MIERYRVQREEILALLQAGLPAERAARISALVRDAIALTPRKAKKADAALGASRLGGAPDLPRGMPWPAKRDGRVVFVGQLRCEQLAAYDVHNKLPARGLISFFHGFATNGEYEAEARVFHFQDVGALEPAAGARRGPKLVGLEFAPCALLPPHSSPLVPLEGPDDPYCELFDRRYRTYDETLEGSPFHGLFGFDRPLEGAQREGEEVLLRLDCDNVVPYDFVEASCAYFFAPRGAAAEGDFSRVRLYEGASI